MDPTLIRWRGVLAVLNQRTGDGRMIRSLSWPDLPVPLRWAREDTGAHDGAVLVGQIDAVEVVEDEVRGAGFLDSSTEEGTELLDRLRTHGSLGVSLDLDDADFEVWTKADRIEAERELWDTLWDEDATPQDIEAAQDEYNEVTGTGGEQVSEEGERYVVSDRHESDEQLFVFTDALVRAATIVDVPAFVQASIELDTEQADEGDEAETDEQVRGWRNALVASAAPVRPPREWFENPRFDRLTPIVVTDEGRVYGHAGQWGMCHTGSPVGVCMEIPPSDDNYARFRAGYVVCDDGTEIATGPLTMGSNHASTRPGVTASMAEQFYANSSLAVADVVVGDDAFGPWVSGALRPGVTPEQVRELRGSVLSGDWREVWDGKAWRVLMIAAHAVNTAGSHVPRLSGSTRNGRLYALVASAGVLPQPAPSSTLSFDLPATLVITPEQVAALGRLADKLMHDEQAQRTAMARALASSVHRGEALDLVRSTAQKIGV